MDSQFSNSFTSKTIENQNIYDLNHTQISQLVQDLIRNDISIKSKILVKETVEEKMIIADIL